jgi:hypothetical protein
MQKIQRKLWGCKGFEGLTRRLNVTDGHIVKVKVLEKQSSAHSGTNEPHDNHQGKIRTHTVIWNGVCSYRKLKLKKEDHIKRHVCPICGHNLVPLEFVGEGLPDGGQWWLEEFEDNYLDELGVPKWREKPKARQCYE